MLVAGSRSVQAKALAEAKSVTIALPDRPLNERVRVANILEVRGEGTTLRVPLDRSAAALERLEFIILRPKSPTRRYSSPGGAMQIEKDTAVSLFVPHPASRRSVLGGQRGGRLGALGASLDLRMEGREPARSDEAATNFRALREASRLNVQARASLRWFAKLRRCPF
jgi:hypothetical protein